MEVEERLEEMEKVVVSLQAENRRLQTMFASGAAASSSIQVDIYESELEVYNLSHNVTWFLFVCQYPCFVGFVNLKLQTEVASLLRPHAKSGLELGI